MAEMSRRFNFDDFDELCREALDEHTLVDRKLAEEDQAWEEHEHWLEHDTGLRPGEIGAVVTRLSFSPPAPNLDPLPEPPEAA